MTKVGQQLEGKGGEEREKTTWLLGFSIENDSNMKGSPSMVQ